MTAHRKHSTPRIEDETEHEAPAGHAPQADHDGDESGDSKGGDTAKKLISLRIAPDDLVLAKSLATEQNLRYQTLVCQILHEGLLQLDAERQARALLAQIKTSLPALALAQELANSPAVKAAQELLSSPAVKAAQELVSLPVIKAADEFQNSAAFKAASEAAQGAAQNFTASPAYKAAQDAAQNFADVPAVKAASALISSSSAKLLREWVESPAFKAAQAWVGSAPTPAADGPQSSEIQALQDRVHAMQAALEKAGVQV